MNGNSHITFMSHYLVNTTQNFKARKLRNTLFSVQNHWKKNTDNEPKWTPKDHVLIPI